MEIWPAVWTGRILRREPLTPGRDGSLRYGAEQSLQMILVAAAQQLSAAQAVLEGFATTP